MSEKIFDQSLNENLTTMILSQDPAGLSQREAAALADKLTNDDGVQRRVLAGDYALERWIGELACRADGLDPNKPDPFISGGLSRDVYRDSQRSTWEREDAERADIDRNAYAAEGQAEVDALNQRIRSLTSLGWDEQVAFDIAKSGKAETDKAVGLDPYAYERGQELARSEMTPRVSTSRRGF